MISSKAKQAEERVREEELKRAKLEQMHHQSEAEFRKSLEQVKKQKQAEEARIKKEFEARLTSAASASRPLPPQSADSDASATPASIKVTSPEPTRTQPPSTLPPNSNQRRSKRQSVSRAFSPKQIAENEEPQVDETAPHILAERAAFEEAKAMISAQNDHSGITQV